MPTRISNPPLLIQCLIAVTALALTLFVAIRLSFIQGILRRVTIDGPSMAPHLCGTHYDVTCADCKFPFPCDTDHLPTDNLAACPNCGYTANQLDHAQLRSADRVLIDRWPLLWTTPKRGSVVAISLPNTTDLAVKRIAALPGERLAIQDGDLFANGQRIRKTAAEFQSLRQIVHNNSYLPLPVGEVGTMRSMVDEGLTPYQKLPPRWKPLTDASAWQPTPTGFCITPPANHATTDWLQYENWKSTADPRTRGLASPITDNDSYNQGETRRPLNTVTDVLLSCRFRASGPGQLLLAATAGNQRFELTIEPHQHATLRQADQILIQKRFPTDLSRHFVSLEFGLCDQQVLLVINGRTVLRHPYELSHNTEVEPLHPLAIGTSGLHIEFHEPRIWRDLYYLDPQGLSRRWELPTALGNDEYALLGDNQPVSIDSRHWQPATIPRSAILGHVYQPFWASRRLD